MKRHLLVDGDSVVYQVACAAQTTANFGGEPCVHFDEALAERKAKDYFDRLLISLKADSFSVALSDKRENYFRMRILPSYKAHRSQGKPPVGRSAVKKMFERLFDCTTIPTLEADDVLGVRMTLPNYRPDEEKVCISIDKDLKSVPGLHWNPQVREEVWVEKEEAARFHMFQTLTGDVCDGFKGCPGVGPKKADKYLSQAEFFAPGQGYWKAVVVAYEDRGLTEQDALTQARVARICHASDWDFDKKEVKLWNPPI